MRYYFLFSGHFTNHGSDIFAAQVLPCCAPMKGFKTHAVVCAPHMHNILLAMVVEHAAKKLCAVDWRVIHLLAIMHAHFHVHYPHAQAILLLSYTHPTATRNSR